MDNANYGKYFVLQMDLIIVWTKFMILWITNGHGNGQKRRNNARTKKIPYTKNGQKAEEEKGGKHLYYTYFCITIVLLYWNISAKRGTGRIALLSPPPLSPLFSPEL